MADTPDQLATADQLAKWMNITLSTDDRSRAEFILQVASGWARDISGKAWPDADDIPKTVWGIVLASSRREFENPRHVTYEVKGPETGSYDRAAYSVGFFSDVEIKYLRKFRPSGGLWSQAVYRDEPEQSLGYLYAADMTKPLPMYNPWEPGWEDSVHL